LCVAFVKYLGLAELAGGARDKAVSCWMCFEIITLEICRWMS